MGGDRGEAAATKLSQERPLGVDGLTGGGVLDFGEELGDLRVGGKGLDGEGALSHGRKAGLNWEVLCNAVLPTHTDETGGGEDYGIVVTVVELADTSVDVAAYAGDIEIGASGLDLNGASGASGADTGIGGQVFQAAAVGGKQHVPGIEAFQHCCEDEALGGIGGHVLKAVDCGVDLAGAEPVFQCRYEDAPSAQLGDGRHLVVVSEGMDGDDFDVKVRVGSGEGPGCFSGLLHSEITGPRPQLYGVLHRRGSFIWLWTGCRSAQRKGDAWLRRACVS